MKKLYISLIVGTLSMSVQAQIDPPCAIPGAFLCDNFDAYAAGDYLGPNASWWTTWSGAEGTSEDAVVVSDYAYSGTNSMKIPGGGITDCILRLGDQSSGVWKLEWMALIPDTHTGYYNIQESETPGVAWNLEVLYGLYDYTTPAPSGEGVVMVPVENNFSYPVGEWFKVEHIIDLDANTFTLKINDVLVLDEAYTGNIGGIDFYSIDANNEQYIDDVLLIELVPTTYYADTDGDTYGDPANTISVIGDAPDGYVSDNTDCDDTNAAVYPGATEVFNGIDDDCDTQIDEGTVFVADITSGNINVYPTPAHSYLNVEVPSNWNPSYTIQLFNNLGQLISTQMASGTSVTSIDVTNVAAGMYTIMATDENHVAAQAVIIE